MQFPNTIFSGLQDTEFMSVFKSIDTTDNGRIRQGFRELLIRDLKVNKNLDPSFCNLAKSIIPNLLNKSNAIKINDKFYKKMLYCEQDEFIIHKKVEEMTPYLLRKAGKEEYYGVVRFRTIKKSKDYHCTIYDLLAFENNDEFEISGLVYKTNHDKMQMFSKIFPVNKIDLQGDIATEEDLRQALIFIVKNGGMKINVEHQKGTVVSDNDAIPLEAFQVKKDDIIEGMQVTKGDLVSTIQFFDTPNGRNLFEKAESGEFKSFSMQGTAQREEL